MQYSGVLQRVTETVVCDLASGSATGKTHLAIAIARTDESLDYRGDPTVKTDLNGIGPEIEGHRRCG